MRKDEEKIEQGRKAKQTWLPFKVCLHALGAGGTAALLLATGACRHHRAESEGSVIIVRFDWPGNSRDEKKPALFTKVAAAADGIRFAVVADASSSSVRPFVPLLLLPSSIFIPEAHLNVFYP